MTHKKNRIISILASTVAGTLLLSGCQLASANDTYSKNDPLLLRYADYAPATASGPFQEFANEVEHESDGRLQLDSYWGGGLLGSTDLPSGTRAGIADIGVFTATHHPSEYPVTNWMASLASEGSTEFPDGILQTYAGLSEYAYKSESVNKQFEDLGLKLLLSLHTILKYDLICTTPVETNADARGKRVRSGGPLWDGELRAAGMIPVNVPIEETYEGLQRGVIDCSVANPRTAMLYGFWDIAKYYTEVPLSGVNSQYIVINRERWDSLSVEDQDIVWDAGHTWWAENIQQDAIDLYMKLFAIGEAEQGLTFLNAAADLEKPITDHQDEVVKSLPSEAPAVLQHPQKDVDDYIDTMDYWLDAVEGMKLNADPADLDLSDYFERTKTEIWDQNRR